MPDDTKATYYYILNAQGDVVKLINAYGTTYATYRYDAWGRVLSATGTLAEINPLRYRGYYYDTETGWYYLQSRYYDPILKRFLNADSYASTGQGFLGYNMFAYCHNCPVNKIDPSGDTTIEIPLIGTEVEYYFQLGFCSIEVKITIEAELYCTDSNPGPTTTSSYDSLSIGVEDGILLTEVNPFNRLISISTDNARKSVFFSYDPSENCFSGGVTIRDYGYVTNVSIKIKGSKYQKPTAYAASKNSCYGRNEFERADLAFTSWLRRCLAAAGVGSAFVFVGVAGFGGNQYSTNHLIAR